MDCLFNLQVPHSTATTIILRPVGKTFITGVASCYDNTYDKDRLSDYLTEKEFSYMVNHLNETVNVYWPCAMSIWIGYLLAPFTLGLSFMIPNICIKDAKINLIAAIER